MRGAWAIRSFSYQLVSEVKETFHLNNSELSMGTLWLGVLSPSASHLKYKKSNKQQVGQSVYNYNRCTHMGGMCRTKWLRHLVGIS